MDNKNYVIGVDYGTDSCRAILVDTADGSRLAESACVYPRWAAGKYCDPAADKYRQHPSDYVESFKAVISEIALKVGRNEMSNVKGLSFDTTASTPVLVNEDGIPLSLLPEFNEDPDAMFVLWKDHTARKEAEEINKLAKGFRVDYTSYSGGAYSPEWVWAKVLHILRTNKRVASAAYSWTEHCDWMPAWVVGDTKPKKIKRSRCAAGHKAMWRSEWGGLPSEEFLNAIDPALGSMRGHLYDQTYTADECVGVIMPDLAEEIGLPESVRIGVGSIDAHVGAVGASIAPGVLVRIMGTSTCDIIVSDRKEIGDRCLKGISGQVDGSVLPGFVGFEAGQAAFGDVYAWFRKLLMWPVQRMFPEKSDELSSRILPMLEEEAVRIKDSDSSTIALDWMNGRRTPDADPDVKGAIAGITLGTTAPMIYKALVEATAFGSKAIINRFLSEGIRIDSVRAVGGISQKSAFVMQTLSDVIGMPIAVASCDQACAHGAAMFASVASGVYSNAMEAQEAMKSKDGVVYEPDMKRNEFYQNMYDARYAALGRFASGDARSNALSKNIK